MIQPEFTAFVPCFNNASTVVQAIESLINQTYPPREILVIDDGSIDHTIELVSRLPVRIIRHKTNLGRGAARATAVRNASYDLVACCDATNTLDRKFCELAVAYFEDCRIAAVFGRIQDSRPYGVAGRWRARHLFKSDKTFLPQRGVELATFGTMMRRSTVLEVGNFDPLFTHTEDAELGARLSEAGFDTAFDPSLIVNCNIQNTIEQVLERYWRWYVGSEEADWEFSSWKSYLRNIVYSVKVMAWQDIINGDFGASLISLICPHYQFWKPRVKKSKC